MHKFQSLTGFWSVHPGWLKRAQLWLQMPLLFLKLKLSLSRGTFIGLVLFHQTLSIILKQDFNLFAFLINRFLSRYETSDTSWRFSTETENTRAFTSSRFLHPQTQSLIKSTCVTCLSGTNEEATTWPQDHDQQHHSILMDSKNHLNDRKIHLTWASEAFPWKHHNWSDPHSPQTMFISVYIVFIVLNSRTLVFFVKWCQTLIMSKSVKKEIKFN